VTLEKLQAMMADNKVRLVSAHRAEDWQEAKRVSLERELIKRRIRRITSAHCPECGQGKTATAWGCRQCYLRRRNPVFKNKLK
jgi:lipopolysaccharide biosynthesis regulator YciM